MTVEADQVLVAIGQAADLVPYEGMLQIERGLIRTDRETRSTSLKGIFAGGDVTGGSVVVVEAMAEGRRAAQQMDQYLREEDLRGDTAPVNHKTLKINPAALLSSQPVVSPRIPLPLRTLKGEDMHTITEEEVLHEANRCANCGCVAVNASDMAGALIALGAEIRTSQRRLAASELFTAAESRTTVLKRDEMIEEVLDSPSQRRNSSDLPQIPHPQRH